MRQSSVSRAEMPGKRRRPSKRKKRVLTRNSKNDQETKMQLLSSMTTADLELAGYNDKTVKFDECVRVARVVRRKTCVKDWGWVMINDCNMNPHHVAEEECLYQDSAEFREKCSPYSACDSADTREKFSNDHLLSENSKGKRMSGTPSTSRQFDCGECDAGPFSSSAELAKHNKLHKEGKLVSNPPTGILTSANNGSNNNPNLLSATWKRLTSIFKGSQGFSPPVASTMNMVEDSEDPKMSDTMAAAMDIDETKWEGTDKTVINTGSGSNTGGVVGEMVGSVLDRVIGAGPVIGAHVLPAGVSITKSPAAARPAIPSERKASLTGSSPSTPAGTPRRSGKKAGTEDEKKTRAEMQRQAALEKKRKAEEARKNKNKKSSSAEAKVENNKRPRTKSADFSDDAALAKKRADLSLHDSTVVRGTEVLDAKLRDTELKLKQFEEELNNKAGQIRDLMEICQNKERENTEIHNKYATAEKLLGEVNSQKEEKETTLRSYLEQYTVLQDKYKRLNEDLEETKKREESLHMTQKALLQQLADAKEKAKDANAKVIDQSHEYNRMSSELSFRKWELSDQIEKMIPELRKGEGLTFLGEFKQRFAFLTKEMTTAREEKAKLHNLCEQVTQSLSEANCSKKLLDKMIDERDRTIKDLKKQIVCKNIANGCNPNTCENNHPPEEAKKSRNPRIKPPPCKFWWFEGYCKRRDGKDCTFQHGKPQDPKLRQEFEDEIERMRPDYEKRSAEAKAKREAKNSASKDKKATAKKDENKHVNPDFNKKSGETDNNKKNDKHVNPDFQRGNQGDKNVNPDFQKGNQGDKHVNPEFQRGYQGTKNPDFSNYTIPKVDGINENEGLDTSYGLQPPIKKAKAVASYADIVSSGMSGKEMLDSLMDISENPGNETGGSVAGSLQPKTQTCERPAGSVQLQKSMEKSFSSPAYQEKLARAEEMKSSSQALNVSKGYSTPAGMRTNSTPAPSPVIAGPPHQSSGFRQEIMDQMEGLTAEQKVKFLMAQIEESKRQ